MNSYHPRHAAHVKPELTKTKRLLVTSAIRGVWSRKGRLAMSLAAIALGIAFVVGSSTFTSALDQSFRGITQSQVGDVMVEAGTGPDLDATAVDTIRQLDSVSDAVGLIRAESVFLLNSSGEPVGSHGEPSVAMTFHDLPAGHGIDGLTVTDGRAPESENEITVDARTLDQSGHRIGDTVTLTVPGAARQFESQIVGSAEFGQGAMSGTLITMPAEFADEQLNESSSVFSEIWVTGTRGTSQSALAEEVSGALGPEAWVRTGDEAAEASATAIQQGLGFIEVFLLVFAGIALVVAAFLISNTFAMLIAQRGQELALMRALGARRTQVITLVIVESFAVALLGSALGVAAGLLLAHGISAVAPALGFDLGDATVTLDWVTVVLAFVIGITVTLVASLIPAVKAGQIPPVAAMRGLGTANRPPSKLKIGVGLIAFIASAIGLITVSVSELSSSDIVLAVSTLGLLIGAVLLTELLAAPFFKLIGIPMRRGFGTLGTLAEQNAIRNPARTAATASALSIALALVSMMSVFGESSKASIDELIFENLRGDFFISDPLGTSFSSGIRSQIAEIDGVAAAATLRTAPAQIERSDSSLAAIDPVAFETIVELTLTDGRMLNSGADELIVQSDEAEDLQLTVGDTVEVQVSGSAVSLEVVGLYENNPAVLLTFITTLEGFATAGGPDADNAIYVTVAESADIEEVRSSINQVIAEVPSISLKDQAEYAAEQRSHVDVLMNLIFALLGLTLVIAVLGIINTLALSVIERTREIGLLRAIALTPGQLRRIIQLEAVSVSLLGATLGVVLGLILGIALQRSQSELGITVLVVPWGQLVAFWALAAVIGVLAAWWPAARAAKLNPLRAIATT